MHRKTARRMGIVTALAAVTGALLVGTAAADSGVPATGAGAHTLSAQGYKSVHLGMTKKQALATHLLTGGQQINGCTWYHFVPSEGMPNPGDGVVISPRRGVVNIEGTESMRTPQGLTMGSIRDSRGSTRAQVEAAFPRYSVRNLGGSLYLYDAPAPGHRGVHYEFAVGGDTNQVKDMSVTSDDSAGCLS